MNFKEKHFENKKEQSIMDCAWFNNCRDCNFFSYIVFNGKH